MVTGSLGRAPRAILILKKRPAIGISRLSTESFYFQRWPRELRPSTISLSLSLFLEASVSHFASSKGSRSEYFLPILPFQIFL